MLLLNQLPTTIFVCVLNMVWHIVLSKYVSKEIIYLCRRLFDGLQGLEGVALAGSKIFK